MDNIEIARVIDEIADLLEIQGANPFRIRAYRNAARTVGTLDQPVESLLKKNSRALEELPGIGADLAEKIAQICRTGTVPLLAELTRDTPRSLITLLRIPGIGPKRAGRVFRELGIKTLTQLEHAARSGQLATLHGMDPASERAILQSIEQHKAHGSRFPLFEAEAYARPLVERLRATPGVTRLGLAGSLRRRSETVGDIDILVASTVPRAAVRAFVGYNGLARVLGQGETKCSGILRSGPQVDLRIVPEVSYGAALHYFTGAKAHSIAIRRLGIARGLTINEYGVFREPRRLGGRAEEDIYRAVGLPWIPPELRENRGEIAAARAGRLPILVESADLRGDLHMHTTATDGMNTLAEMIQAAVERRYEYIAITDHSQDLRVARGMSAAGFRRQSREIDAIRPPQDIAVLKGAEVDILEDGSLDLDDGVLAELDLVVASIHSGFNMTKAAMSRRVVRALKHPAVQILAHPTGRLIGRREPYAIDMAQVISAARDHGVLLEVNGQPGRLDLNDRHIAMATRAGVKLVVSSDAHRTGDLAHVQCGVEQARRGWCTRDDIANTRHLEDFRGLLRQ